MNLKKTLFIICMIQICAFSQTPIEDKTQNKTNSAYKIIFVSDEQKIIEEKTLEFQSEIIGTAQSHSIPGSNNVGMNSKMTERTEDVGNAARFYAFKLKPSEKLNIKLNGKTEGNITMKFLPKNTADAMTSQVRMANMAPTPLRKSKINIKNITKEPYQVVLMLFGQANYPYILEIKREL